MLSKLKQFPLIYLFQVAWKHAEAYRIKFVVYILLCATSLLFLLSQPLVIGRMINVVQEGPANIDTFYHAFMYLLLFMGFEIMFWVLHGPARVMERRIAFHIRTSYELGLFKAVTELPAKWHRDNHSGQTIIKLNRASLALGEFWENSFQIIHLLVSFFGSLGALFFFMPISGLITIVLTVVAVTLVYFFDSVLLRQYADINAMFNRVASALQDYVLNIVTIITLRLEDSVLAELKKRRHKPYKLFSWNVVLHELKWFSTSMTVSVTVVLSLGFYIYTKFSAGEVILAGTLFMLFDYLRRISEGFFNFTEKYGEVVKQTADVRSAEDVWKAHADLFECSPHPIIKDWHNIDIKNISFVYEDETHRKHHLKDIDITLKKGTRVALVGESGSGKSTLLGLLRGLQLPKSGDVFFDGKKIDYGWYAIGHCATLIPQDPEIMSDTIRFNVTFGIEASEETIMQAVRLAQFESTLQRLPQGLDTHIAEKGVNLSGGEKQRLALARGIFFAKHSDIILLDEPTSSVDSENERIIYENLIRHFSEHCLVSSLHKLNLLPLFDEIYVFSEGCLVESGSLPELLEKKGTLSELWKNYQTNIHRERS